MDTHIRNLPPVVLRFVGLKHRPFFVVGALCRSRQSLKEDVDRAPKPMSRLEQTELKNLMNACFSALSMRDAFPPICPFATLARLPAPEPSLRRFERTCAGPSSRRQKLLS